MVLRKKKPSKPRIRKNNLSPERPWKWLLIVFILILELFIYTGTRVECTNIEYATTRAHSDLKKNRSYGKELIIELERLGSPQRISSIATTRLGLSRPAPDSVIYLEKQSSGGETVASIMPHDGRAGGK